MASYTHVREGKQQMDDPVVCGVFDAKTQLSRLIALARAGRDVVLTNRNVAVARIVPFDLDDFESDEKEQN